jgi:hypothetical protein
MRRFREAFPPALPPALLFVRQQSRRFTTGTPSPFTTSSPTVNALNSAFHHYPGVTGLLWLWHSQLFTLGYFSVISLLGAPLAPELAPAFVLHAAARRLRLPFTLAAAAVLARAFPPLCTVPVARLLVAPLVAVRALMSPQRPVAPGSLRAAARAAGARVWAGLERLDALVGGSATLNTYGLAYIYGGRLTGTVSLLGLTLALRYGVDIEEVLKGVGRSLEASGGAGHRAAWVLGLVEGDVGGCGGGGSGGGGNEGGTRLHKARDAALYAKDITTRWAAAALALNFSYPLALRFGVAGGGSLIGARLEGSPRWNAVVEAVKAGQREAAENVRAEEANAARAREAAERAAAEKRDGKGGGGGGGEGGLPAAAGTGHWISRYYKTGHHCC